MNDIKHWRGFTSSVNRITPDIIRKSYRLGYEWMAQRESKFLCILSKYSYFPKLIAVGKHHIDLSYCGEQVKSIKKYQKQLYEVLDILNKEKIIHRDINPKNLLELNNEIRLIDFGWSLFDGELDTPIKAHISLGGRYYSNRIWDDSKAVEILLAESK